MGTSGMQKPRTVFTIKTFDSKLLLKLIDLLDSHESDLNTTTLVQVSDEENSTVMHWAMR